MMTGPALVLNLLDLGQDCPARKRDIPQVSAERADNIDTPSVRPAWTNTHRGRFKEQERSSLCLLQSQANREHPGKDDRIRVSTMQRWESRR